MINYLPVHVAIIMDGNGRWAEQHGLSRLEGHYAGTENCHRVIEEFNGYGIKYLTLYAFSTENWLRPQEEVQGLFQIMAEMLDRETQALHERGVSIHHLGKLDGIPPELKQRVQQALELTKNNTGLTLSIAFNYGARAEIADAMRRIIEDKVAPQDICEDLIGSYLYTAGLPDPDLIIRTAGEMRLSNFLLWQNAYSEYYYTPVYWPDFNEEEIKKALVAYGQRERRFGGLGHEAASAINSGEEHTSPPQWG
jgi:undecaprenyl diphosphate synthase